MSFHFRPSTKLAGGDQQDTFAARVRAARRNASLTQAALAEASDYSVSAISKMETGSQLGMKDAYSMSRLARALGVNPVWLYAGMQAPRKLWPGFAWVEELK